MSDPNSRTCASCHNPIRLGVLAFLLASLHTPLASAETGVTNVIDGVSSNFTGSFLVGATGPLNALVITNAGRLFVTGQSIIGTTLAASNNSATVTGIGTVWNSSEDLYVGHLSSGNRLSITAGAVVNSYNASLGNYAASGSQYNNAALVDGSGSTWTIAGSLYVGRRGTNNGLTISNGGTVSVNGVNVLGLGTEDEGHNNYIIVSGTGSVLNSPFAFCVGGFGSDNRLLITNGGAVFSGITDLGLHPIAVGNTAIVTGNGSLWSNDFLHIGGINSRLTIADNGTVLAGTFLIGTNPSSSGASVILENGNLLVTNTAASALLNLVRGTLTLNSGTVVVDRLYVTNGASSVVNFNAGTLTTKNGSQIVMPAGSNFFIGTTAGQTATWNILGGTNTLSWASGSGGVILGGVADGTSVMNVSGPGTLWSNVGTNLQVGGVSAGNQLTITNGARVMNVNGYIGNNATSSNNTALVSGAGSVWSNSGVLHIGNSGSANSMIISNGGHVFNTLGTIGNNATASNNWVVVTGSGSVWSNSGSLLTGIGTSGNSLTITEGGRVINSYAAVGVLNTSGICNSITVTGSGSVWSNSMHLYIGHFGGENQLTVSNGAQVFASNTVIGLAPDSGGNVVLVSGSNSILRNVSSVSVGANGSTNQLVISDGGQVFNTSAIIGGSLSASNNSVWVTGSGSLWSNSSAMDVGSAGGSRSLLVVTNGAHVFSSGSARLGTAGLGSNSVVVTGSDSLWVNNGSISIGPASSNNSVTIAAGGQISCQSLDLGSAPGFTGNLLLVTGTNSLLSTGLNTTNALTVGRSGSFNQMIIASGAQVSSYTGYVGQGSSAFGNSVFVTDLNSVWSNSNSIYIGSYGDSNSLTIANGGRVYSQNGYIGAQSAAFSNTVLVTGSASLWTNWNTMHVGSSGAFNRLIIADGGRVIGNGLIGYATNANNNSVLVTGTGSTWGASVTVGYSGSSNSMTITNGGLVRNVSAAIATIGMNTGANNNSVLVTGSGSLWSNWSVSHIGGQGSFNSLTITNGGNVINAFCTIGFGTGASNNSVSVSGVGSLWKLNNALLVGSNGPGSYLTIVDGGTVTATNVLLGFQSTSTGNVIAITGGNLYVTNATGSGLLELRRGALTLNSGTVVVDRIYATNGASSLVNFNGGTFTSSGSIISNGTRFAVGNGTSAALLNLAGGTHSFVDGLMIANNGTVANDATLNTPTLVINSGGQFTMNSGLAVVNIVTNSGTFIQNGGLFDPAFYDNTGTFQLTGGTNQDTVFLNEAGAIVEHSGGQHDVSIATNFGSWSISGTAVANLTNFVNNSGTLTVSGGGVLNGSVTVGGTGSLNQLFITNGGSVFGANNGILGNTVTSRSNTVLVSGAGSLWSNGGSLYIGNAGSGNSLIITNGGRVYSQNSYIGAQSSAISNTVLVTGTGTIWNNSGDLYIGHQSSGNRLSITAGAVVSNNNASLGNFVANGFQYNNLALVEGTGSTWTINGWLAASRRGTNNGLVIRNGGTVNVYGGNGLQLGSEDEGHNNYLTVDGAGAVLNLASTVLCVGGFGSGNQLLITNGGAIFSGLTDLGLHSIAVGNTAIVTGNGSLWSNNFLHIGGFNSRLTIADNGTVLAGTFVIGTNTSSSGASVIIENGNLFVTNAAANALLNLVRGTLTLNSGTVVVDRLYVTNGASSVVNFNAGTLTTKNGSQIVMPAGSNFFIGTTAGQTATWNILGGTNTVSWAGGSGAVVLGGVTGVTSVLNVSGPATLWSNTNADLQVGGVSAGNQLTIDNGGQVFSRTGYVGYASSSSNNTVVVTGTGSVWSNSALLFIGDTGSFNTLTIADGGQVLSRTGYIGYASAGDNNSVLVTGTGSVWRNAGNLFVGNLGSGNSLVISNGGAVFAASASIGNNTGADGNSVIVSGAGSVWSNSGSLMVGDLGAFNTLTLTNGGRLYSSAGWIGNLPAGSNNSVLVTSAGSAWTKQRPASTWALQAQATSSLSPTAAKSPAPPVTIGWSASANNNAAVVSGSGSLWTNSGSFYVGYSAAGNRPDHQR